MKKTIIAIGGGEIGRIKVYEDGHSEQKPIETMVIDKKIIELTGKAQPKLVFIGAASGDDPRYFKAVSDHFGGRLGCHTENLVLTDSTKIPTIEDIRKIILGADIVYVGGGCVTRLMNALKKTGADKSACTFHMARTEQTADITPGAVPEHKTESLENRHQRKDDSRCAAGRDRDLTDEKGVRRIVYGGDHHADHCRDRQPDDQLSDARLRHKTVFLFFGCHSFIVRLIRLFFSSTPSTFTLTTSPAFSTSLGCLI